MSSKECEEQLESLVEAWQLNEADLNQTDIDAMKHLLLENQMQQDKIIELKIQVSAREEVANKYKKVIEEVREVINKMIYTGYMLEKDNSATQFMATSKKSEFGIRAEVLLQILDKGESNE